MYVIGREINDELFYINKIYYYAVGTVLWYYGTLCTGNCLGAIQKVLDPVGNFKNSCNSVLYSSTYRQLQLDTDLYVGTW